MGAVANVPAGTLSILVVDDGEADFRKIMSLCPERLGRAAVAVGNFKEY